MGDFIAMRGRRRRPFGLRVSSVLGAFGLLLAACGGDDDAVDADDPVDSVDAVDADDTSGATTSTPEENAAAEVDPDVTFRFAQLFPPTSWDPHLIPNFSSTYSYITQVYDSLLRFDGETGELIPNLAEEFTYNADSTELTLKLRSGVTFSDGEIFDADAVVANVLRAKDDPNSFAGSRLQPITEVTAVDPSTVKITLSKGDAAFANELAGQVGYMVSPKALSENPAGLAQAPVGSGPYRLVSFDPAKAVFESNPDYWNTDHVYPKSKEILVIPDPTARLNALRTGQVDMIAVSAGPMATDMQALVDSGDDFQLRAVDSVIIPTLMVNTTIPPLDDVNVRRALSLALDREALANSIFRGFCVPQAQYFPAWHPARTADVPFETDVAEAERLVTEAGAAGATIQMIQLDAQPYLDLAIALKDQIEKTGLKVELIKTEAPQARPTFRAGGVGTVDQPLVPTSTDPRSMMEISLGGPGAPGDNPGGVPAELQTMLDEAASLPVGDDRLAAYGAVDEWLAENPIHIPICANQTLIGASSKVVGLEQVAGAQVFTTVMDTRFAGVASD